MDTSGKEQAATREEGAEQNNGFRVESEMAGDQWTFMRVWSNANELDDPISLLTMAEAARVPNTHLSVLVRTTLRSSSSDNQNCILPRFYAGPSYLRWNRHAEYSPDYDGHPRDPCTNLPVEFSDYALLIDGVDRPIQMGKLEQNKTMAEMTRLVKMLFSVMLHYDKHPEPTGIEDQMGSAKQLALAAMLRYGPDQLYNLTPEARESGDSICTNGADPDAGKVLATAIHRRLEGTSYDLVRIYKVVESILLRHACIGE